MRKIINKNRPAHSFDIPAKGRILSLLQGQKPTDDDLDFDGVRAALGLSKEDLPDGHIEQVVVDAGYDVF